MNLAGVEMVIELTELMERMQERLEQLRAEAEEMRRRMEARQQTALVRLRDIRAPFGEK
jgi:hypothetical protein